jgi:hypothetical protein
LFSEGRGNNDTQIKTTAIRCSMDQSSSSQAHAGGTESPSPISRPSLSPEDPPYFPPAACRRRRPPTPPRLYCIAYRRRDATPGERTGDTAARAARLGARADATRRETRFVACEVPRSNRGARPTRQARPPSIPPAMCPHGPTGRPAHARRSPGSWARTELAGELLPSRRMFLTPQQQESGGSRQPASAPKSPVN